MILPLKFLVVYVSMTVIDAFLKYSARETYSLLDWVHGYKYNMGILASRNAFICLLIFFTGGISNLALLGLIISIPLYFIL